VPQIRVKAKRIGLPAMRAGLNAKMGCHRASQRRAGRPPSGGRTPDGVPQGLAASAHSGRRQADGTYIRFICSSVRLYQDCQVGGQYFWAAASDI